MKKLSLVVFLLSVLTGTSFALTFALVPQQQTVLTGQSFSEVLLASDYQPDLLGAFQVDLAFTATIVSFGNAQFLFGLGTVPSEAVTFVEQLSPGLVRLGEVSLLDTPSLQSLQSGNPLPLAILNFVAGETGFSQLALQNAIVGDANGNPLLPTLASAVDVNVVPEPATLVFFGTGLMGLMLWRWKLRASNEVREITNCE